jgi:hypothetical protein
MTPTLPPAAPLPPPEEVEVALPPLEDGVEEDEEQPATPNAKAAAPTVAVRMALRIIALEVLSQCRPGDMSPARRSRNVVTGNVFGQPSVGKGSDRSFCRRA